ncbi:DegV family protein [Aquibacillus salsiterrae]|uniref:DegV family protein n=1 Tax=Aquibacillus salsiterrae TaxID=2950439 RepID=A0A9X4AGQ3_9BACI|nr:DegV family protein [Aquibacillus salsiterrae]MDC3417368.1 DegV family protein [Aquibacillus salsiterrae]
MKKIAWVTDSTASFSKEDKQWLEENHVFVVPMGVSFGDVTFKEEIDITVDEFYKKMMNTDTQPMSSQPALGDFINLYEKLKENYDEAVVIHASSKLTGVYSSSVQAAEMVGFPINPIDSWIGSFPLRYLIETGLSLHHKGMEMKQLISELIVMREKGKLYLLPSSLEQLRRSGRVSNFGSLIGNILQIKPILALEEGKVIIVEKVRTLKKAEKSLLTIFHQAVERGIHNRIAVIYAGDKEAAEALVTKIKESYQELRIEKMPLIPVAGVHTGPETIGLAWVEK